MPSKRVANAIGNIRVKDATIANFATVIIQHSTATRIAMQMLSARDSLLAHNGVSTPCGTRQAKSFPMHIG